MPIARFPRPPGFGALRNAGERLVAEITRARLHPPGAVVAVPTSGEIVYRGIGRSDPREWDFQSDRDKGRPRAPQQDYMDYVGLSVFGTEAAARQTLVRFPKIIAHVRLDADRGFMIARTLVAIEEHYSLWADPNDLLQRVDRVTRFDESD